MLQLNKLDAIHNAEHAMMGAAKKGHIHILKWMQKMAMRITNISLDVLLNVVSWGR